MDDLATSELLATIAAIQAFALLVTAIFAGVFRWATTRKGTP